MENTHEEWLDSAQDQYISVEQHTHLSSDQMGPCNPIGRPFKVKLVETDVIQGEMPDLRRGVTGKPADFQQSAAKEMCSLAGVKAVPRCEPSTTKIIPNLREKYEKSFGIRQTWAKQDLHYSSGMPVYMQKVVEGSEDEYEKESLNYCRLAGLKYKTSKEKMKLEIDKLQADAHKMLAKIVDSLNQIVGEYKQLELEN